MRDVKSTVWHNKFKTKKAEHDVSRDESVDANVVPLSNIVNQILHVKVGPNRTNQTINSNEGQLKVETRTEVNCERYFQKKTYRCWTRNWAM
jgi:hypothetical protein